MPRRKNHKEKLAKYSRMIRLDEPIDVIVTVVKTNGGEIICDGNHRAIASYMAGHRCLHKVHYIDIRYGRPA